ncbi:N-acetylglucosamine-6-phosphate deacetylase [Gandjariella thermophila]|uniref:N-acetylglucosamine-6-phosphate deacetylase n=1 Tax=Gandjariella thermophila TaxID=1931992 RepID=A0A4D4JC90_9PSEU|nr:N-acetylglucosamine-6-phosphate deacetylase [Gandjariella thermophila]GDY31527.1 N-acetylglucosamine-6-phosphate deacetylase [Gandjariella thermophila]
MVVLDRARIVTETGIINDGHIAVEGETIVAVEANGPGAAPPRLAAEAVDLAGHWVLPGFVDLHNHGGGGGSYATGDPESALRAYRFHRKRGTTTSIASLVTASVDDLARDVAALAELVDDGVLAGLHLEGPFISQARCGAHDPHLLRAPDLPVLRSLLRAGRGAVRMVTLAPELEGGITAVRHLAESGVTAAVGHTDAAYHTARDAFAAGATVATHLFNAMRPIHHREPGPITAALEHDGVIVELINDGVHLHDAVVRAVFGAVGAERVALITDAISAAGLPDGSFRLGPMRVRVSAGVARLASSDAIAGSTLTQDAALRRAVLDEGLSIVDVSAALSATPARVLGLDGEIGTVRPGKRADLVVLDADLAVVGVMARGRWITRFTGNGHAGAGGNGHRARTPPATESA